MGRSNRSDTLFRKVDFPVYGIDFAANDTAVAVGGGGSGRSGVKNKLVTFDIHGKKTVIKSSLDLSSDEDCPMSVACHPHDPVVAAGVNMSPAVIREGKNESCRLFDIDHITDIRPLERVSASSSQNIEDYQKVSRFSPSTGRYLVTGYTDGKVSVFKMPELSLAFPPVRFNGVQDCDIDWEERHLAVATPKALVILSLEDGTIVQVIDSPRMNGRTVCEFRACRYARGNKLYAAVNPVSRGKGFICVWSTRRYPLKKARTASVCRKSITSFCVSPAGNLLAFASSDLTIGLVDAKSLRPVLQVKKAHEFAITSLAFNRTGRYLASAGADTRCRITRVPDDRELRSFNLATPIYAALCVPLLILLLHIITLMTDTHYSY